MIHRATLIIIFIVGVFASRVMATPVPFAALIASLLFLAPSAIALYKTAGKKTTLFVALSIGAFALIVEELAVATGIPYSRFVYSELLGATAISVPLVTPLSFLALALGAYTLAQRSNRTYTKRERIITALIGGAILVAADLVLDPAATLLGLWVWHAPGAYYGVPLINYFGWLVIGGLATLKLTFLLPRPHPALAISFILIITYWTGVAAGLGLMIPAGIGAIGSVLAYHRYRLLNAQYK